MFSYKNLKYICQLRPDTARKPDYPMTECLKYLKPKLPVAYTKIAFRLPVNCDHHTSTTLRLAPVRRECLKESLRLNYAISYLIASLSKNNNCSSCIVLISNPLSVSINRSYVVRTQCNTHWYR